MSGTMALESIFDAVSYAVVAVDLDLMVTYLNQPARDFLQSRGRVFDPYVGMPSAEILPLATPRAREAMKTREFQTGRGRVVDKGKELFFEITPLMQDGGLEGCVISLQHPERFEELANKLSTYQQLSRQMQAIFDSSSDGIWVTDGQGVITNINRASMTLNGVKAEDIIGRKVGTILHDGLVDQSVTLEVLEKRRQVSIIQHLKHTDRQILATGTPVFDDNGDISLVVVNERDLTDLNNLRRDLAIVRQSREQVQRELEELSMLELEGKGIVAESKAMRKALRMAMKLAHFEASNILLLGESGVGKGMLAKFIHKMSSRKHKPFLAVNCAALPENLFEAELFGYKEGSFTGARQGGRIGFLELAGEGTLFLDEIGEMPQLMQVKLLKCLDELEYMPIGGNRTRKVKCAIITATNRDLESRVRRKRFRKDLFYRLNTFSVRIPPLRERPEDVYELARHFLETFNLQYETTRFLSLDAMELLQDHDYPGNVRELKSLMKKSVVMSDSDDLEGVLRRSLGKGKKGRARQHTLPQAVAETERDMLGRAAALCESTRAMAEMLGVSQPTVVRKMQKYGLNGN